MQDDEARFALGIGPDGAVIIDIDGVRHILGLKASVCLQFEKFLSSISHESEPRFAGKTVAEWDKRWTNAGPLTGNFSTYRNSVGLYRAVMDGKIMYIGKACEYANGGLRKRLADYTRQSDSARNGGAGPLMHSNRNAISVSLLVTGEDREAAQVAQQLEHTFIAQYSPPWNSHGSNKN